LGFSCGERPNTHPPHQPTKPTKPPNPTPQGFPSWQVLLVDLRCHGDSAAAAGARAAPAPHTVDSAARDVLELLRERKMFPQMLIGHSFGGKVVMSMARQFGVAALPRPVQVWVLDTLPGEVRAGSGADGAADHPAQLISALQRLPLPIPSRAALIDYLTKQGFSLGVSRWMTTNLRPADGAADGALTWAFDLDGIADLYQSYEDTCLWDLLKAPPQGLRLDFVRATQSNFRWSGHTESEIAAAGHRVHPLEASHWVHADNPQGLFNILAPTFGPTDFHMQRPTAQAAR
jgi:pimeloyl-ACP methyl ester carboxylesterase